MNITIFEKYWGNLSIEASSSRIDFLPKIAIISMTHANLLLIGFLNVNFQLTLWTKDMREYLKNPRW